MKYSSRYVHRNMEQVSEIKCPVNRLGDVYDYFKSENSKDKRCNIVLESNEIPEYFYKQVGFIKECVDNNYTIACNNFNVMKDLLSKGYNAYFDYPITDWEMFNILKSLGVSDIFIDGPLGFQMDKIKIGKENILIRVSPAASASASLSSEPNIKTFFIRPEDMYLYEDAIDIIDFRAQNTDTEKVLLDIYIRGTFDHELSILIKHLNAEVRNPFIDKSFGEARVNCGQKCQIPGYKCRLCESKFRLTNLILNYVEKTRHN